MPTFKDLRLMKLQDPTLWELVSKKQAKAFSPEITDRLNKLAVSLCPTLVVKIEQELAKLLSTVRNSVDKIIVEEVGKKGLIRIESPLNDWINTVLQNVIENVDLDAVDDHAALVPQTSITPDEPEEDFDSEGEIDEGEPELIEEEPEPETPPKKSPKKKVPPKKKGAKAEASLKEDDEMANSKSLDNISKLLAAASSAKAKGNTKLTASLIAEAMEEDEFDKIMTLAKMIAAGDDDNDDDDEDDMNSLVLEETEEDDDDDDEKELNEVIAALMEAEDEEGDDGEDDEEGGDEDIELEDATDEDDEDSDESGDEEDLELDDEDDLEIPEEDVEVEDDDEDEELTASVGTDELKRRLVSLGNRVSSSTSKSQQEYGKRIIALAKQL